MSPDALPGSERLVFVLDRWLINRTKESGSASKRTARETEIKFMLRMLPIFSQNLSVSVLALFRFLTLFLISVLIFFTKLFLYGFHQVI